MGKTPLDIMVPKQHHHMASETNGAVIQWQLTCLAPLSREDFEHVAAMTKLWLRSLERKIEVSPEEKHDADN